MSGSHFFTQVLNHSIEGREITARSNYDPSSAPRAGSALLIGGQHGDEPATVHLLESFSAVCPAAPTTIIPCANPDGFVRRTRYNARGVDPNRNFGFNWHARSEEPPGPAPWSEPETCALRDFILAARPSKIVSLHWALAEIDADGPQSTALAEAMWDALSSEQRRAYRLRITEIGRGQRRLQTIYAACPGSLGQWCGYGLLYPDGSAPAMITLELPYDPAARNRPDELPEDHLSLVHGLWRNSPENYLDAVLPGVHAMLQAAVTFDSAPL